MAKQTNQDGYRKVLAVITKSRLAKNLRLTKQAVGNWGDKVPEGYAFRVSIITGIPIEQIIPEAAAETHQRLKELAREEAQSR